MRKEIDLMKKEKTKSAPILVQMFIYAAILFVAQVISDLMPKSFPVPTPVIGLVLLYFLLTFHVIKVEWVDSFGSALISLISFMFVPSGISLAANLKIMKEQGIQLIIVVIASTIILLVVTAYTTKFFSWVIGKVTNNQLTVMNHKKVGDVK
ncbi:murein hydrolase regulator LrgA [Lactobacillus sp. ESL0261]|uniref:Murein hydrolase regulator LrgA n=2 Tax=Lactobacillus kullabergensis TaxID=1218493 RepID=A0ABM6W238_9LACO|nr:murein hydrolase regulator LrgA [Lactobacillus kullabergensis]RMC53358.1 murein hydrolase regulator LrgA [Lactobacillus sp. ESL0261]